MKTSTVLALAGLAVVLALVAWLCFGHSEALILGVLALLPAGQRALNQRTYQGEVEQATEDRTAANNQRTELTKEWSQIDAETERDVSKIEEQYATKEGPPTKAEEDEMLQRFTRRGGPR